MRYYQEIADKKGFVAFQFKKPKLIKPDVNYRIFYEHEYTKYSLAKYFGLKLNSKEMNSPQISATSFFIKKNNRNINFLEHWLKACGNLNLINNTKSILPNHKDFKSHRNDQSAFSLLCKIYKIHTFSVYDDFEVAYKNNLIYWGHLKNSPMQFRRKLIYFSLNKLKKRIFKLLKISND